MTDPGMQMAQAGGGDDTAMRRQRLAQMLMSQATPQQAYNTSGGTAMATGAQALGALGQNQQFMKWLSGQFETGAAKPMAMEPMTGRAVGPV